MKPQLDIHGVPTLTISSIAGWPICAVAVGSAYRFSHHWPKIITDPRPTSAPFVYLLSSASFFISARLEIGLPGQREIINTAGRCGSLCYRFSLSLSLGIAAGTSLHLRRGISPVYVFLFSNKNPRTSRKISRRGLPEKFASKSPIEIGMHMLCVRAFIFRADSIINMYKLLTKR